MTDEPLYLIGAVGGRRIAIDAAPVDSVVGSSWYARQRRVTSPGYCATACSRRVLPM